MAAPWDKPPAGAAADVSVAVGLEVEEAADVVVGSGEVGLDAGIVEFECRGVPVGGAED